jgi:hypothetical protein
MKNEILEELWKTRKEIEDQEGGDIKRVFERKKKTSKSKRKHYSGTIRTRKASGNT